ncbi:hypothetical protein [Klenkia marina]|nr:hypothetical protein [Klenkia marina]
MRHVAGFVVGLVLAAAALLTVGNGALRLGAAVLRGATSTDGFVWLAVGAGVLGVAAALRRLSPLVPLLAGAPFVALGVLVQFAPEQLARFAPRIGGEVLDGLRAFAGVGGALVVGVVLVLLALVPQGRRRARLDRGDDGRDDDGFTAVPTAEPEAWRSGGPSTNAYPSATPYERPPLDRPSS